MTTDIIITGAAGRMGSTLAGMVNKNPRVSLAGVVERPGLGADLSRFGAEVFTDIEAALCNNPGAVVIDFTTPEAGLKTARGCERLSGKAVIGTTGFTPEQMDVLRRAAEQASLFWAPNMSVGINTLLAFLPRLAGLLGEDFDVEISEIHHRHKKDAPSGTALKLGEALAGSKGWDLPEHGVFSRHGDVGERPAEEIGIQAIRGGDVAGDHTVYFLGTGERIEVTHRAHSRETFAQGAIRAALWLAGEKPGRLYSMQDMLTGKQS